MLYKENERILNEEELLIDVACIRLKYEIQIIYTYTENMSYVSLDFTRKFSTPCIKRGKQQIVFTHQRCKNIMIGDL